MSRGRKIALILLAGLLVLALVLAIIIPRLVDVDRYRPNVIARLEQQTQRPVSIDRLTLRILPSVSIRVEGLVLGNPPGFPAGDFVRVERIDADLDWRALLNRRVTVTSLTLEQPAVALVAAGGRWNYEAAAPGVHLTNAAFVRSFSTMSWGVISKVKLEGAQVQATRLAPAGQVTLLTAEGLSATLEQVDLAALGLAPGGSSPEPRPATFTPTLDFETPLVAAPLPPSPEPIGEPLAAHGSVEIAKLRSGNFEVEKLKSKVEVFRHRVSFDGLNFDLYGGHSQGSLALDFSGPHLRYDASLQMQNVNMATLLDAFPSARGKMTGTLEGQINLTGLAIESQDPLADKQGNGEVTVRNGQLPTLQLNRNLILLMQDVVNYRPGSQDPSSFSTISADLNISGGRILSRKVTIVGNGVDLDASGSLALAGAGQLNYDGVARIDVKQSALSSLLGGLLGGKLSGGKLAFKFGLGGTLAQPHFTLKSNPLLGAPNSQPGAALR
jgi:uncharacterized protein involved in outer membrane biogenesis